MGNTAHLFGDVYWVTNPASSLLFVVAVVFLLTSPALWGDLIPGVMRTLYATFPSAFEWVVFNWTSVGFIALGAAAAWGVRFNVDDEDDQRQRVRRSR